MVSVVTISISININTQCLQFLFEEMKKIPERVVKQNIQSNDKKYVFCKH